VTTNTRASYITAAVCLCKESGDSWHAERPTEVTHMAALPPF